MPTPAYTLHQEPDPRSNEAQKSVDEGVGNPESPTPSLHQPTPENPEIERENDAGVGGVGGVGKMPNSEDIGKIVDEIAQKALKLGQADNRDYFTLDDWLFECSMWPNLGWKIIEAEQALKQLLQQGKIMEVEPDRYTPTDKLNSRGVVS
jgi:hypothetical protein